MKYVAAPYSGGSVTLTSVAPTPIARTAIVPVPLSVSMATNAGTSATEGFELSSPIVSGFRGGGVTCSVTVVCVPRTIATSLLSKLTVVGSNTVTSSVNFPPPRLGGRVTVMAANPGVTPLMGMATVVPPPAGTSIDAGTLATDGSLVAIVKCSVASAGTLVVSCSTAVVSRSILCDVAEAEYSSLRMVTATEARPMSGTKAFCVLPRCMVTTTVSSGSGLISPLTLNVRSMLVSPGVESVPPLIV